MKLLDCTVTLSNVAEFGYLVGLEHVMDSVGEYLETVIPQFKEGSPAVVPLLQPGTS